MQIVRHNKAGMKRDFAAAFRHLKTVFNRKRALFLYQHGRTREIVDAIDWTHYRQILKTVFDRWARTYEAGATLGVRKINGVFHSRRRQVRFKKAIGDRFGFDRFDDETVEAIRDEQDQLIKQLETSARETIHQVVLQAQRQGISAEETVDDIWSVIGLTDTQAQAVLNYENMLYDLAPDALERRLRDDTYDETLEEAIANNSTLAESVIKDMVDAYEDNMYTYRAETIARTESSRAAHMGLRASYRQAIDRGVFPEEAVRREWLLGDAPCPICESIPDMNEGGVGVDEDFQSIDGPQDDAPVHPNCYCSVEYVTDLTKVPEDVEQ
jgi:hypothetical protein